MMNEKREIEEEAFDDDIDDLFDMANADKEDTVVIRRELKFATFEYDETEKTITIETRLDDSDKEIPLFPVNGRIKLNAVYSFALLRFVIRIAQRNWFRKLKK